MSEEMKDIVKDVLNSIEKPPAYLLLSQKIISYADTIVKLTDFIQRAKDCLKKAEEKKKQILEGLSAELQMLADEAQIDGKLEPIVVKCGDSVIEVKLGRRSKSVCVEDEVIAFEYLREFYPEAIRIKEEVDKRAIKKIIEEGEEIPGITLIENSPALKITVNKEEVLSSDDLPALESGEDEMEGINYV